MFNYYGVRISGSVHKTEVYLPVGVGRLLEKVVMVLLCNYGVRISGSVHKTEVGVGRMLEKVVMV